MICVDAQEERMELSNLMAEKLRQFVSKRFENVHFGG